MAIPSGVGGVVARAFVEVVTGDQTSLCAGQRNQHVGPNLPYASSHVPDAYFIHLALKIPASIVHAEANRIIVRFNGDCGTAQSLFDAINIKVPGAVVVDRRCMIPDPRLKVQVACGHLVKFKIPVTKAEKVAIRTAGLIYYRPSRPIGHEPSVGTNTPACSWQSGRVGCCQRSGRNH